MSEIMKINPATVQATLKQANVHISYITDTMDAPKCEVCGSAGAGPCLGAKAVCKPCYTIFSRNAKHVKDNKLACLMGKNMCSIHGLTEIR